MLNFSVNLELCNPHKDDLSGRFPDEISPILTITDVTFQLGPSVIILKYQSSPTTRKIQFHTSVHGLLRALLLAYHGGQTQDF